MKTNRIATLCGALIVLAMAVIVYARSNVVAIYVPTFHMDGAFQTASGLFRLADGQLPQKDFFPYLGIGPIFMIFPAFIAFGENFMASIQAAFFTTMVLAWFATSTIWRLVFQESSWKQACIAGAPVLVLCVAVAERYADLDFFTLFIEPGNSLRPVRSSAPFLAAVLFLIVLRSNQSIWRQCIWISCILGTAMLWSNDYALPTAFVFSCLVSVHLFSTHRSKSLPYIAAIGFMSILIWLGGVTVITAGHTFEFLAANYIDTAGVQWWYFSPFQNSNRVYEFSDLVQILMVEAQYSVYTVPLLALYLAVKRNLESALLFAIGLTALLGGLLPTIAAFAAGYFVALMNFSIVLAVIATLRLGYLILTKIPQPPTKLAAYVSLGSLTLLSLCMLGVAKNTFKNYTETREVAETRDDHFFSAELNGYAPKEWEEYFEYVKQRRSDVVIEEYWGLWSALNGQFADWPADSVIHIFGDARHVATDALQDATYVTTSRFDLSPLFQPWSFTQNYWFYGTLLRDFEVATKSPKTVVWKRAEKSKTFEPAQCRVASNKKDIIFDNPVQGLYEISVSYEVATPKRRLMFLRNNLGSAPGSVGLVSLPAVGHTATLPVWINGETGPVLQSFLSGKTEEDAVFTSCEAKRIDFNDRDVVRYTTPNCEPEWMKLVERVCLVVDDFQPDVETVSQ